MGHNDGGERLEKRFGSSPADSAFGKTNKAINQQTSAFMVGAHQPPSLT